MNDMFDKNDLMLAAGATVIIFSIILYFVIRQAILDANRITKKEEEKKVTKT
jgi:hypothetical protein